MSTEAHLVIGANGAIGRALVKELAINAPEYRVYAVARQHTHKTSAENVRYITLDTANEDAVASWVSEQRKEKVRFKTVVCTAGILHGEYEQRALQPEKKIEDVSSANLMAYFAVNTVVPALWLKALITMMAPQQGSITCLSARVGSIEDNQLGGWYGYRASKAALNMIIKTAAVEYRRRSKQTVLVSYHPGTVDSALSEPFQKNVPQGKLFTAPFTASQLLRYLNGAAVADNPHYVDWKHQPIAW
ncbi:SDR family NAD(P)-dependent oxidoreductase [Alteromonas sp. C1M14]|uniref:SDR family NAD(P)-dependent oxidoreductase n=1 Tax=Alteromonas sp. C1M14 TaxID=2841567 RepID=UPI001C095943|nr:SDR family NAD(P)-dependent oxidoreductase [Alteromonas sp. C1M14]MBU2976632.1 SDR family NAD(P)-dependent oxidoreductase [Alteromonas sp. C1M14]